MEVEVFCKDSRCYCAIEKINEKINKPYKCKIKGIDDRIVNHVAMLGLGMPDAFWAENPDISKALEKNRIKLNSKEIMDLAELWRPYRAYAVLCPE